MEVWIQFVPSEGGHASFSFSSHSPALPNICGRFPYTSLFTYDTHSNRVDWAANDTSSYLDLSVVYGYSQAVASLKGVVLFSRDHNFIAKTLLKIKIPLPLIPIWRRNRTKKSSRRQDQSIVVIGRVLSVRSSLH
jgi:hypothetical protein